MNEQQKRLVAMLNDMYHSQSDEYKSRYRDNYFELLQHIISPGAYITGEEIAAKINKEKLKTSRNYDRQEEERKPIL